MAQSLSGEAQSTLGLARGTKFYVIHPINGMNLKDSPTAIADSEFLWCENFFRLGDGNLRTGWDVGAPLYTAPSGLTIVSFAFYTIGTLYYVAIFQSDGSAVQVSFPSGIITPIAGAGTFFKPGGSLPACSQWGTLYLLISNRNTVNDYWAWDGKLLYTAGTAAPNGAVLNSSGNGYTIPPTVTPFGGLGHGMVIVPTVQAGGVVQLQITNPGTGYEVGDVVQAQFTGGGSDTGAILQANLNAGEVAAVNVTAPGSGYTAATIAFTGGGGTGAAGTVQVGTGVTSIAVTNGGTGYLTGAAISFTGGGGSGATASAVVVGGVITEIDVTAPGTGYTSAPTVVIAGAGSAGAATASIQGGIVTGVTVTAPGSGYTTAPSATISGDGTGATAQTILSPSSVSGVTVVNPGSGFISVPNITFVGGGGVGAAGTVLLNPTSVARIDVVSGGTNYTQIPTVSFSGAGPGGDGGLSAVATLDGGSVSSVIITNPGSGIQADVEVVFTNRNKGQGNPETDTTGSGAGAIAILAPTTIQSVLMSNYGIHYTTAPAIEIQPGANNAASAIITMMPFGVSGDALETYQQRAWLANPCPQPYATLPPGGNWQVSAPGGFTDFATSDGGVLFTNSDGFLQTRYTGIRQSNGYLYFFGDGSISVVSSVTTSGSPSTTTFNYQNVDPQTGLSWRDSQQEFGRTILFANETGVYGLYGGAATKLSDKLNGLFDKAVFPTAAGAVVPSSASATIHDVRFYLMLMTVTDPDTGLPRNVLVGWNEKDWAVFSQTVPLLYVGSQKIDSKFTSWGTDGNALYPLFAQPSASLTKRLYSKQFGGGQNIGLMKALQAFYLSGQDQSAGLVGIDCNLALTVSGLAIQSPMYPSNPNAALSNELFAAVNFPAPPPYWPVFAAGSEGVPFQNVGFKLTTTSPDFVLASLSLSYTQEFFQS